MWLNNWFSQIEEAGVLKYYRNIKISPSTADKIVSA